MNALYTQNASYSIIDADLLNTLATETVFYSMPMYDVNIGSPLAGCMEAIDEGLSQGLIREGLTPSRSWPRSWSSIRLP